MSPEVKTLVERLGIKVVSFKEIEHKKKLHLLSLTCFAFYSMQDGYIAVNENLCKTVDQVNNAILHEVIHWTGDDSRLKRQSLAQYHNYQNYEEHLAQRGALELARQLGIASDNMITHTEHYCNKMYPIKSFEKILLQEDIALALHFIMNVSNRKVAA